MSHNLDITMPAVELRAALSIVGKVVDKRSPRSAWQCVLLSAVDGGAWLEGVGSSFLSRRLRGVQADGDGRALVDCATLSAILNKFPTRKDTQIRISADGEHDVFISVGFAEHRLAGLNPDLFAVNDLRDPEAIPHVTVLASDLARAIRRTLFATDPSSTRYALGGLLLQPVLDGSPGLSVVGSDGRRLAFTTVDVGLPGGGCPVFPKPTVVPSAMCAAMLPVLDDAGAGALAVLGVNATRVTVGLDGSHVTSNLVQGRYPDWRQTVGRGSVVASVRFPVAGPLIRLVEAASLLADRSGGESAGVVLELDGAGRLLAWSQSEHGTASVELAVDYLGPRARVSLAPDLLLPALKAFDVGETVGLDLRDGPSVELYGAGLGVVVMPLTDDRPSRLGAPLGPPSVDVDTSANASALGVAS